MILEFSQKLKFIKNDINCIIFLSYNKLLFILVYINNFLIINNNSNIINGFKNKLFKLFCMTNLRLVFSLFKYIYYLNKRVYKFRLKRLLKKNVFII